MSTVYPKGTFKIITAKQVIAGTMYANKKLEVSFKEVNQMRDFFDKKLKESQTEGYAQWDSESIKDIKREENSFFIGENFVNCIDGWKKIQYVLSYYDLKLLNFLFEYEDILKNKEQKLLEKISADNNS